MSLRMPQSSVIGSSLVEIGGYELQQDENVLFKKVRPVIEISQSFKTTDYQDFLKGARSKTPASFHFTHNIAPIT